MVLMSKRCGITPFFFQMPLAEFLEVFEVKFLSMISGQIRFGFTPRFGNHHKIMYTS